MKLLYILIVSLALSSSAFADDRFQIQGGPSWSIGQMGDGGKALKDRGVNTFSVYAMPTYNLSTLVSLTVPVRIGPMIQFDLVGQQADPAEVNNSNLKGSGYKAGVGISSEYRKFHFLAGVQFLGVHNLSKQTASGSDMQFSKYVGGTLRVEYAVLPWASADLVGSLGGFGRKNVGATETDLTDRIGGYNVGIGATFRFPFTEAEAPAKMSQ